jgi:type IV secretory pathway VirB3-like protein
VGQESNLRPASVEFASLRPLLLSVVLLCRILLHCAMQIVVLCPPVSLWVVVRIVVKREACSMRMLLVRQRRSTGGQRALTQRPQLLRLDRGHCGLRWANKDVDEHGDDAEE